MDIKEMLRNIIREELTAMVAGELTGPANVRVARREVAADDAVETARAEAGEAMRPRVTYWLTKAGRKANAGKNLRGNNAKMFSAIAKREGQTKRQLWEKCQANISTPKSAESNIYQLQTLGLIESREV